MLLGEKIVEHGANLGLGEPKLKGAVQGGGDQLAELLPPLAGRAVSRGLADPHPLAPDPFDDAVRLEPGVRLANGHGIYRRKKSHLPDAGKQVARLQLPARDQGVDLVDELPIDRDARAGVDFKEFGVGGHSVLL